VVAEDDDEADHSRERSTRGWRVAALADAAACATNPATGRAVAAYGSNLAENG